MLSDDVCIISVKELERACILQMQEVAGKILTNGSKPAFVGFLHLCNNGVYLWGEWVLILTGNPFS